MKSIDQENEYPIRILNEMLSLMRGAKLTKAEITDRYQITTRTFFRDMGLIKQVADENGMSLTQNVGTYQLEASIDANQLTMIAHILLASGTFTPAEKDTLLTTLISALSPSRQSQVRTMLATANKAYRSHNQPADVIYVFEKLSKAIALKQAVTFMYRSTRKTTLQNDERTHTGFPDCLFYDHGNYYCAMYEHSKPGSQQNHQNHYALYRLDRFSKIERLRVNTSLIPPHHYDLAAHRNNTYLLSSGEIVQAEFYYRRYPYLVADAFPTAKIDKKPHKQGTFVTIPQVRLSSIVLWVLSQGTAVTVHGPQKLKDKVLEQAAGVIKLYAETDDNGGPANVMDQN